MPARLGRLPGAVSLACTRSACAPEPTPGQAGDNYTGLTLYADPSTGYTYGPDLNHPYVPNPGGSPFYSSSNTTVFTDVDTPVSASAQAYATTADATLGGASVFDMTFNAPFSDPTVQAAVAQADALLSANGVPFEPPTLTSSQTSISTSTSTVQTGESDTGQKTTVTGYNVVGNYLPDEGFPDGAVVALPFLSSNVAGYYPPGFTTAVNIYFSQLQSGTLDQATFTPYISDLLILPGQQVLDTNVENDVTVDRTVTTTTTNTLTQTDDIVGTPRAANAVPEPSAFALLTLGLLPVGLLAARRRKAEGHGTPCPYRKGDPAGRPYFCLSQTRRAGEGVPGLPGRGYNGGMSAYTITITLTPEEDAALRARALRDGRAPEELLGLAARAPALPGDGAASGEALLEEYHRLVDVEMTGRLTAAQTERLRSVEARLDEEDARNPVEQAMDARVRETGNKLDEILDALRRQPLRPAAPASAP